MWSNGIRVNDSKLTPNSQTQDKMLSVAEVAGRLGVARITVRRWLKAKNIGGFQLPGGHYRIPLSEVQRIQAMRVDEG